MGISGVGPRVDVGLSPIETQLEIKKYNTKNSSRVCQRREGINVSEIIETYLFYQNVAEGMNEQPPSYAESKALGGLDVGTKSTVNHAVYEVFIDSFRNTISMVAISALAGVAAALLMVEARSPSLRFDLVRAEKAAERILGVYHLIILRGLPV